MCKPCRKANSHEYFECSSAVNIAATIPQLLVYQTTLDQLCPDLTITSVKISAQTKSTAYLSMFHVRSNFQNHDAEDDYNYDYMMTLNLIHPTQESLFLLM